MKKYVLLGHPSRDIFNGKIFNRYIQSAGKAGHEVRSQALGEMRFDPVLWESIQDPSRLEANLKTAQENILWCDEWEPGGKGLR